MPVIGTQQSPIRIVSTDSLCVVEPKKLLEIQYDNRNYHGRYEAENFKLDGPAYPKVSFRGRVFELRKIHIHHKAEHLIDDVPQREFEIHLFHLPEGGKVDTPKLVIGILYHESAAAASGGGLEKINESLRKRKLGGFSLRKWDAREVPHEDDINPLDFFYRNGGVIDIENWCHYEGSLTSGTFSEDVSWFVMAKEAVVHPDHTEGLKDFADQDARAVHALDRRIVVRSFM